MPEPRVIPSGGRISWCSKSRSEIPNFTRSGGECVCDQCHKEYWRHDYVKFEDKPEDDFALVLHHLCDGTWVKL